MIDQITVKKAEGVESSARTYSERVFLGGKMQRSKAREMVLMTRFKKLLWEKMARLHDDDSADRVFAVLGVGDVGGEKFQMQLVLTMNAPDFLPEDGKEAYLGKIER